MSTHQPIFHSSVVNWIRGSSAICLHWHCPPCPHSPCPHSVLLVPILLFHIPLVLLLIVIFVTLMSRGPGQVWLKRLGVPHLPRLQKLRQMQGQGVWLPQWESSIKIRIIKLKIISSGNLCEHQCDNPTDCIDLGHSCSTTEGYSCSCKESLCSFERDPEN